MKIFVSLAKAGTFGALFGLFGPFLYFLLVGIFTFFLNSGTDWLDDGIFSILVKTLVYPSIIAPLFLPISLAAFSIGGVLVGIIGFLVGQRLGKHQWLSGIISGILGLVILIRILPSKYSNFFSTNLILFYIPGIVFVLTMICISLYTHRSVIRASSNNL